MENQHTPQDQGSLDNFFNISFDTATRAQIRQAAVWAKLYAICAFVGYGIALVVAFFGRLSDVNYEGGEGFQMSASFRSGRILGALLVAAIGVFINYFLYRFATSTIRGIDAMDNITTNDGLNHLRRYFRILGILLIIALSLLVLFFVFGLLAGLNRLG
ncbi:MAG TPA: hypothetical protein VHE54_05300 [Puia sp.]|nr:hypothetical protein [Puia sp.]